MKIQTPHQFGNLSMKIPITFTAKTMNTCASDRKIDIQNPIINNLPAVQVNKPGSVNENKFFKNASENIQPI